MQKGNTKHKAMFFIFIILFVFMVFVGFKVFNSLGSQNNSFKSNIILAFVVATITILPWVGYYFLRRKK